MASKKLILPLGLLLLLLPTACTEEESDLGMSLQDPAALYHGTRTTVPITACTLLDDSLVTTGYTAGVVGTASSSTFGSVNATIYSQITISGTTGISFTDDVVVDSAIMTLVIDTFSLPSQGTNRLHMVATQLSEKVDAEKTYYASDSLPESSNVFFDSVVDFTQDSLRLHLRPSAYAMLKQTCSNEEFLERVKGFSLRLSSPQNAMLVVNYEATNTRITLFYHTPTTDGLQYTYVINSAAAHFMNYRHDYAGTPLTPLSRRPAESVDGAESLYLQPLGGTCIRINMQSFLDTFCTKHPNAVIHYAELLLPVSNPEETYRPQRILAYSLTADGTSYLITDGNVLLNTYTYSSIDGSYSSTNSQYRLRVTRHIQSLMRTKKDYGIFLYIDGRRSSCFSTVLNGYRNAKPLNIQFVYSE